MSRSSLCIFGYCSVLIYCRAVGGSSGSFCLRLFEPMERRDVIRLTKGRMFYEPEAAAARFVCALAFSCAFPSLFRNEYSYSSRKRSLSEYYAKKPGSDKESTILSFVFPSWETSSTLLFHATFFLSVVPDSRRVFSGLLFLKLLWRRFSGVPCLGNSSDDYCLVIRMNCYSPRLKPPAAAFFYVLLTLESIEDYFRWSDLPIFWLKV